MSPPELRVFRRIMPDFQHVPLLEQIAAANWNDKLTAQDLINEVSSGRISVWEIEGCSSGLALLRVEQSPTRRVLILDGIAGHNVLTKGQAIKQDLTTIAREFGCSTVETSAKDPRWQAVSKRLGFAPVSVVYEMRID